MHLGITGNIDFKEGVSSPSDLLFLGFHGYGNDESEMVRIINAICGDSNADNTTGSTVATFTHYPTTPAISRSARHMHARTSVVTTGIRTAARSTSAAARAPRSAIALYSCWTLRRSGSFVRC